MQAAWYEATGAARETARIGITSAPGLQLKTEALTGALRRGLMQHVAGLRQVDIDEPALDELLAERAIFEYWSHEASFLPAEAYPLYRSLILIHSLVIK